MSSVSALNFCFYRNNMCENTSAVRLPGVWLDDGGANKQFWFQEDSCFLPSANIYLKTRYLHRNNIWGFTLRCTHCHGDGGGRGRGITLTPHLQQGENLSSLSSNTPWMRRRAVCGFLNGCTVHGPWDVTSPSLLSSPTWFQPGPPWLDRGTNMAVTHVSFRWTRRWIFNGFSPALCLCVWAAIGESRPGHHNHSTC